MIGTNLFPLVTKLRLVMQGEENWISVAGVSARRRRVRARPQTPRPRETEFHPQGRSPPSRCANEAVEVMPEIVCVPLISSVTPFMAGPSVAISLLRTALRGLRMPVSSVRAAIS